MELPGHTSEPSYSAIAYIGCMLLLCCICILNCHILGQATQKVLSHCTVSGPASIHFKEFILTNILHLILQADALRLLTKIAVVAVGG